MAAAWPQVSMPVSTEVQWWWWKVVGQSHHTTPPVSLVQLQLLPPRQSVSPVSLFLNFIPAHCPLLRGVSATAQLFTRDEGQFGSSPGLTMTSQPGDSNDSNDQDGLGLPANTSKVSEKSVMAVSRTLSQRVSPHFIRKLWQVENYVLWDG